jgi:ATP-dependent RNA helicase DeaD
MEIIANERSFATLRLSEGTLASLEQKGYHAPTEVQFETIPRALAGRDLVVQSRTGTGKTAAFGIPIVEKVDVQKEAVQALVLAPTRELALQVAQELSELGRGRGLKLESIYGGDSMDRQLEGIRAGAHVIVGTPGRVLDHLRRGTLRFDALRVLVLDEADRMLDMGFAVEMGQIMEYIPGERQTLLFSATIPVGIRGLIYHYMAEPEWVLLSEDQIYVKEVEHLYCMTPRLHKEAVLHRLMEYETPTSSMVFCNTKEETRVVHAYLSGKGLPTAMLSSDLPQKKRERVMGDLRAGRITHLVTTDVASRGIDIEDLSHVFIYSTPESPEQYIHRAGRTGRVGKSGRAISLVSAHDLVGFNRLVKRYHIQVQELKVPTDEEVTERRAGRIASRLSDEAKGVPLEDYADLQPVAQRILEGADKERVLIHLVRLALTPPPAPPDEEAEDAPPPRPRSSAPGRSHGRRRR